MRSGWIEGSARHLKPGCVVHYVTHSDHEDDEGRVFPAGSSCLALRTGAGELGLVFLLRYSLVLGTNPNRCVASVVWLGSNYGLCGVEPHVLDPKKSNHLMADEACRVAVKEAFEWVGRQETAKEEFVRAVEEGISREMADRVGEELQKVVVEGGHWSVKPRAGEEKKTTAGEETGSERKKAMDDQHDVGWAKRQLVSGSRVVRPGWNGKGMWLEYVASAELPTGPSAPFVVIKAPTGDRYPWVCSQADFLATDYEVAAQ